MLQTVPTSSTSLDHHQKWSKQCVGIFSPSIELWFRSGGWVDAQGGSWPAWVQQPVCRKRRSVMSTKVKSGPAGLLRGWASLFFPNHATRGARQRSCRPGMGNWASRRQLWPFDRQDLLGRNERIGQTVWAEWSKLKRQAKENENYFPDFRDLRGRQAQGIMHCSLAAGSQLQLQPRDSLVSQILDCSITIYSHPGT